MPHIEELPTTAKAAAPGWSYVVDTGYDPSKAAINPTNRKRVRISTGGGPSASDLSVRQQTAIQRHLEELDKDSHRASHVSIPEGGRGGEGGGSGGGGGGGGGGGAGGGTRKRTANVRRILTSGKDFSHYLEEEQAVLALKTGAGAEVSGAGTGGGAGVGAGAGMGAETETPKPAPRASKTPYARRKSGILPPSSSESSPAPSAAAATAGSMAPPPLPAVSRDPARAFAAAAAAAAASTSASAAPNALLAPCAPTVISEAEIESLLATPPLPYLAVRSAPPPRDGPPKRVFCEMCGYWGRVKCIKCGARVCGFECQTAHDESRCMRF